MDKFPLKGSREAAAEGNSYITAYQTVMKKVCERINDKSIEVYDVLLNFK